MNNSNIRYEFLITYDNDDGLELTEEVYSTVEELEDRMIELNELGFDSVMAVSIDERWPHIF